MGVHKKPTKELRRKWCKSCEEYYLGTKYSKICEGCKDRNLNFNNIKKIKEKKEIELIIIKKYECQYCKEKFRVKQAKINHEVHCSLKPLG